MLCSALPLSRYRARARAFNFVKSLKSDLLRCTQKNVLKNSVQQHNFDKFSVTLVANSNISICYFHRILLVGKHFPLVTGHAYRFQQSFENKSEAIEGIYSVLKCLKWIDSRAFLDKRQ